MKQKKWLILFSIVALFYPLSAFGEEREDQVGISFKEEQPVDPKEPVEPKEPIDPAPKDPDPLPYYEEPRWVTPFNNVLPYTLGSARNYYARESRSLPKTGENRQTGMQWTGFLCVACSFWLFLFTRLKEEEEDEQETR